VGASHNVQSCNGLTPPAPVLTALLPHLPVERLGSVTYHDLCSSNCVKFHQQPCSERNKAYITQSWCGCVCVCLCCRHCDAAPRPAAPRCCGADAPGARRPRRPPPRRTTPGHDGTDGRTGYAKGRQAHSMGRCTDWVGTVLVCLGQCCHFAA
jgi:hypothetical protein